MNLSSKRFVSFILIITIILSATLLTSCYRVHSGRMWRIQGTYELVTYSGDGDYKERDGVTFYVVLNKSGTGYYAYADNETPLFFAEMRCSFTPDPEKSGKYSYVNLDFGNGVSRKLAIDALSKNLNASKGVTGGSILDGTYGYKYWIQVTFEKVNMKTSVKGLQKELGDAPFYAYGTKEVPKNIWYFEN